MREGRENFGSDLPPGVTQGQLDRWADGDTGGPYDRPDEDGREELTELDCFIPCGRCGAHVTPGLAVRGANEWLCAPCAGATIPVDTSDPDCPF